MEENTIIEVVKQLGENGSFVHGLLAGGVLGVVFKKTIVKFLVKKVLGIKNKKAKD